MEEDPSVVKKMTKRDPAKLSAYKNNIKQSNALLKQLMRKYWKHHQAPLYKTQAEINQMRAMEKSKKKKSRKSYVIMSLDFFSEKHKTREESEVETNAKYTGDATYLFLRFWEGDEIVYTSLPHVIPTQVDLVYGVRYLSNQVAGDAIWKRYYGVVRGKRTTGEGKNLVGNCFSSC